MKVSLYPELASMKLGEEKIVGDQMVRCQLFSDDPYCDHCCMSLIVTGKGCDGCRAVMRDDDLKVKYVDIEAEAYDKYRKDMITKKAQLSTQ